MRLYVVGKTLPIGKSSWEFQGVFDDEALARKQCVDDSLFVGPVELNEVLPSESVAWPGAYYPTKDLREPKG